MSYPPSSSYSTRAAAPPPRGWSCNKCFQELTTTVFASTCDCVFCEDCTYSHFASSSTCPSCYKTLRPDDFLELVVINQTAGTDLRKQMFQTLFTKLPSTKHGPTTTNNNTQSLEDACFRILESFESQHRMLRFLLNQLMLDAKRSGQDSDDAVEEATAVQAELEQLKQQINTETIQQEQNEEMIVRDIQLLEQRDRDQQKEMKERSKQIRQLEELAARGADNLSVAHSHTSLESTDSGVHPMYGVSIPGQQQQHRHRSPSMHRPPGLVAAPVPYQQQQPPRRSHSPRSPGLVGTPYQQPQQPRRSHSPHVTSSSYGNRAPRSPYSARPTVSNGGNFSAGSGYVFSIHNKSRKSPWPSSSRGSGVPSSYGYRR